MSLGETMTRGAPRPARPWASELVRPVDSAAHPWIPEKPPPKDPVPPGLGLVVLKGEALGEAGSHPEGFLVHRTHTAWRTHGQLPPTPKRLAGRGPLASLPATN